jgi:hypothetical protein
MPGWGTSGRAARGSALIRQAACGLISGERFIPFKAADPRTISVPACFVLQRVLMHLPFDGKMEIFADSVIVASTGSIGFSQRLHPHIEEAIKGHVFKNLNAQERANLNPE